MSTAIKKPSARKSGETDVRMPLDTTHKRVRTTTTTEELRPVETQKAPESEPVPVALSPHEALIERLRAEGNSDEYTISIYRLGKDGRTDTRSRKFVDTIDWDVDDYEKEIQEKFGEGEYYIEVKHNRKLTGVTIKFSCDDPLEGPPIAARNQYQQYEQTGPPNQMFDPMKQMQFMFDMFDRVADMYGSRMPAAPNPAPALPQVIQPAAPAISKLDVLLEVANGNDPALLRVGKFLLGGGETAEAASATNGYDVLSGLVEKLPLAELATHFATSLNKPIGPQSPGQPQQQQQTPAQPGQPQQAQNPAQEKVAVESQLLDFNEVARTFMDELCRNLPVDHVASLITQLGKQNEQARKELEMLLSLPADKVWEAIVQLWPDMKKWEGLTHKLTWIENLQVKLKPAEQGATDGNSSTVD